MRRLLGRLIVFAFIFVLLTACTTGISPLSGSRGTVTPTSTSESKSPLLPTRTAGDACPKNLSLPASCLTPQAIRVAYGVNSLIEQGYTGKGQTIIDLVSFGSPTLQKDMEVYNKTFNLPPLDLQVISPLNVPEYDPTNDKGGWSDETELDVQIIHALAPDAKVIVLSSPVAETEGTVGLPEFRQLEQYVIDHKLGNIVSQSWGASEITLQDDAGKQELQKWNDLFQNGTTQQGITYLSSSGDQGATDYADDKHRLAKEQTTSFAPDSPWVTSVGGTTLSTRGNTLQETAWSGSGGGFSRFYSQPDYQKTLPAQTQKLFNGRRGVPDVAAVADPYTGLAIYLNGQWTQAGGTSASAPVWAALVAIANQQAGRPLGFINPGLYKLAASSTYAQDFHDIISGNNTNNQAQVKGYDAVPGWDPITGLGTPNAMHLIPDLIAAMK